MLRTIEGRRKRAAAFAALALVVLTAIAPGTVSAAGSSVTVTGVERDPRLGRAWLLARLPSDGHLRTTSTGVKAFAPPGDYQAGFVRIPLIPKLRLAKRLRRDGSALVPITIYFTPAGTLETQTTQKVVTLVRRAPARPTRPHH